MGGRIDGEGRRVGTMNQRQKMFYSETTQGEQSIWEVHVETVVGPGWATLLRNGVIVSRMDWRGADIDADVNDDRWAALDLYNAERARGLLHSPEWHAKMAEAQEWVNEQDDR